MNFTHIKYKFQHIIMFLKGMLALLTILAVIAVCVASEERKQKMCGPVLYQALGNICKNGFNTRDRKSGKPVHIMSYVMSFNVFNS